MQYLVFQSDLFSTDQPDDQIGQWFLGADCAGWLYARLLPLPDVSYYCDPVMEDWGWYMAVEVDSVKIEMALYHIQETDFSYWHLQVWPKNKLFRKHPGSKRELAMTVVRTRLNEIVSKTPHFQRYAWTDIEPFSIDSPDELDWKSARASTPPSPR